jgi:superfamily II DNA or RNA helicase
VTAPPDLRPYQVKLIGDISAAFAAGHRRVLAVSPTGSGKTVIAGEAIRRALARGKPTLALAHRREIISQTAEKLRAVGIEPGIIMAGEPFEPLLPVQVASVQTLFERGIRRETIAMPPASLIFIDEAHHTPAATYRKIVETYPESYVLGLTATPERGDGRGLGDDYEVLVEGPQVAELIELRFLVPTKVYAPTVPDLTGVETRQGDYVAAQLERRMNTNRLVGDIVEQWRKHGQGRQTVVFASGVDHSRHIRDAYREQGVKAEHIDGSTPRGERDAILAQLAAGDITVVTNCMVLTEGWDVPDLGCGVLARPTKKMGLYRQMGGRILRPAPGKADAILIDHSGAVHRHGFLEDHVEWTLAPDKRARNAQHEKRVAGRSSGIVDCANCGAARAASEPCRACGFMPVSRQYVIHAEGELGLVKRQRKTDPHKWTHEERMNWWGQLAAIAEERGYKSGWVSHKYREKFGRAPPSRQALATFDPTPEVRQWVAARHRAWVFRNAAA